MDLLLLGIGGGIVDNWAWPLIKNILPILSLLGLGIEGGIVGGLIPSPIKLISLTQAVLNRWALAIFIILGPPLTADGALLLLTLFFYQYIPHSIAHYIAYVGGTVLLVFATYSLLQMRGKTQEELAGSATLSYAGVAAATFAEVAAPGTWVYWLTIAGPILSEGKVKGYWHVVPFFAGSLIGYYGAAVLSVWLMARGAGLHKQFKQHLFFIANILLLVLGVSYLIFAHQGF